MSFAKVPLLEGLGLLIVVSFENQLVQWKKPVSYNVKKKTSFHIRHELYSCIAYWLYYINVQFLLSGMQKYGEGGRKLVDMYLF